MPSKIAARDHEMSWLLFEAADTRMMLVKTRAKRKPRSPPASNPPSPPLPAVEHLPPTAIDNIQQLHTTRVQTTFAFPAYEPPPPYSHPPVPPKDVCHKSQRATARSPAAPPRPPKLPLQPAPASKNPWSLTRARNSASCNDMSKLAASINVPPVPSFPDIKQWDDKESALATSITGLEDLISSKLNAVLTSIDGESFSGNEAELDIYDPPQSGLRGGWGSATRQASHTANRAITSTILGRTNYFRKASLYANSRLPPNLPELKLYMPSYPLLCLAAQYSQKAYVKPSGKEREAHVEANWKRCQKAMVIKSVPIDDMDTIVFAIRGSQTFMDWAVNLDSAPVSPGDFLDDPGNLCHSGFLSVARKMVAPVSSRLRSLLRENPSRASSSLLITGHSAGGAIASLLYAHMLSTSAKSDLTLLSHSFKRIHCLTFGTPPVSLLPLTKPRDARYKKSLFLSFINEGDPVPRADRGYIRSLLCLYASPAPGGSSDGAQKLLPAVPAATENRAKHAMAWPGRARQPRAKRAESAPAVGAVGREKVVWRVPPGTLSNAGKLVVLRGGREEDVRAEITCDEEMRGVVFGDPVMHMMKIYARRIEVLATKAVTARVWG